MEVVQEKLYAHTVSVEKKSISRLVEIRLLVGKDFQCCGSSVRRCLAWIICRLFAAFWNFGSNPGTKSIAERRQLQRAKSG